MSAWHKGDGSEHDYVMRVLAAIIEQSGGEIHVKGELIDRADPSLILKDVDLTKQELYLKLGSKHAEFWRVAPEKSGDFVATAAPARVGPEPRVKGNTGSTNVWDNPRLSELEKLQMINRLKAKLAEEFRQREREREHGS